MKPGMLHYAIDDMLGTRLQNQIPAAHPQRQLEAALVLFDAEPVRFWAALQQVLPPHKRALTQSGRTAHDIVDAAVADDRTGAELAGPELRHHVGLERILAPARLTRFLGAPHRHDKHNDRRNEQDAVERPSV